MHLFHKILGGKANSVDSDQTLIVRQNVIKSVKMSKLAIFQLSEALRISNTGFHGEIRDWIYTTILQGRN